MELDQHLDEESLRILNERIEQIKETKPEMLNRERSWCSERKNFMSGCVLSISLPIWMSVFSETGFPRNEQYLEVYSFFSFVL